MADEPENEEEQAEADAPAKKGGPLPFIIVGILGTGLGLAVPFLLPAQAASDLEGEAKKRLPIELEEDVEMAFIPFTEKAIVANIKGERMTRYVNVSITLKIAKNKEFEITQLVNKKLPVLRDWLNAHLSDKSLEDLKGQAGMNRLRREVRDNFNSTLFPDGYDRIYDILFSEFAIQ